MPFARRPQPLRYQLFVDADVQGVLLRRVALYALCCLIYAGVALWVSEWLVHPKEDSRDVLARFAEECLFWMPGLLLLAPIFAYDYLRVTNRFAGPIFSLRREMQRLAEDRSERPLKFRDEDHWSEMAETFNQIREELLELRRRPVASPADPVANVGGSNGSGGPPVGKLIDDENDESEADEDALTLPASVG